MMDYDYLLMLNHRAKSLRWLFGKIQVKTSARETKKRSGFEIESKGRKIKKAFFCLFSTNG
jgi:hypothetical protein